MKDDWTIQDTIKAHLAVRTAAAKAPVAFPYDRLDLKLMQMNLALEVICLNKLSPRVNALQIRLWLNVPIVAVGQMLSWLCLVAVPRKTNRCNKLPEKYALVGWTAHDKTFWS